MLNGRAGISPAMALELERIGMEQCSLLGAPRSAVRFGAGMYPPGMCSRLTVRPVSRSGKIAWRSRGGSRRGLALGRDSRLGVGIDEGAWLDRVQQVISCE